jgi:hypothetical protein
VVRSSTRPQNKELKLTKPSIMELRSLTPVLDRLDAGVDADRRNQAIWLGRPGRVARGPVEPFGVPG